MWSRAYRIIQGHNNGVQVHKRHCRGTSTRWPMIAINFNIPPELHNHLPYIIPLGIIPGPKAPIDYNSFERPFVDECKQMAHGFRTLDIRSNSMFSLHVYPTTGISNMQAIKHCMCFKGPNALHPCRSCEIKAVHDTSKHRMTYYSPLTTPDGLSWDPLHLPLHTEMHLAHQLVAISTASMKTARNALHTKYGINETCVLTELQSIGIAQSFPYEWMHLFVGNHGENLVTLWQGRYKGLDEGRESYRIPDVTWERIGRETASAFKTIPFAFGHPTPDIWTERYNFTAEDWSFWFVFITPHVLKGCFSPGLSTINIL
jgi:hypothetical protein